MTVDTKGFLTSNKKDPFQIFSIIKTALIDDMMKISGADRQIDLWRHEEKGFTCPNCQIHDFSAMMDITFKYKKEDRRLSVFLDCDGDYSDTRKGKKIILNLGCWGSSVHLMEVALLALREKFGGDAYIDENDCDDQDFRKIDSVST